MGRYQLPQRNLRTASSAPLLRLSSWMWPVKMAYSIRSTERAILDPPRFSIDAPQASNSDSTSAHRNSRARAGWSKTASRTLRCLRRKGIKHPLTYWLGSPPQATGYRPAAWSTRSTWSGPCGRVPASTARIASITASLNGVGTPTSRPFSATSPFMKSISDRRPL